MALGTPVAAATAYGGATTVTPAYPAGILATDVVLLFVGQKPSTANGGTVTTPTGWTLRDELLAAGGYGTTLTADQGNTNLRVYSWGTPVAGQTGNLTVTLGTNNVSWAFMVRIPTGGGAPEYGSADGQRTTTPTSPMSIALTNGATATDFQAGDLAIWAMCIPTDVTTPGQFSAQSVTATGATFATAVELNEPDSNTGNDIGGYSAYASVSSGSSTTAPTVTVTLTGTLTNVRGPVVLLRVREGAAAQTLTPNLYTNDQTFHNPTVTSSATVAPALYTNTQTFYSASVSTTYELTPSLYTNAQTFYSAVITQTGGVQTLLPDLYTNAQTFYAPTVAPGAVDLAPALYTNAQTFFDPAVSTNNTLAPALYNNDQVFYSPTVAQVTVLQPSLVTNAQSFYAPTVTPGAVTLAPQGYVDDGYVDPGYVGPNTYSTQIFYAPKITPDVSPALLSNTSTFYAPALELADYLITKTQALRLMQIHFLHGLGVAPLVVTDTARSTGAIAQSVSQSGTTVTITTTAAPNLFTGDPGQMIDELAALHGLTTSLVVTPTSRTAGTISQTLTTSGTTTTVTRL